MSGNDFEKQVQQKMDELTFAPSATVWPAVEKQIAERKKRRLLFIWLPLMFLLLGGSAWLYYFGSHKKQAVISKIIVAAGISKEEPAKETAYKKKEQIINTSIETTNPAAAPATHDNASVAANNTKSNSAAMATNNVTTVLPFNKNSGADKRIVNTKNNVSAVKNNGGKAPVADKNEKAQLTVIANHHKRPNSTLIIHQEAYTNAKLNEMRVPPVGKRKSQRIEAINLPAVGNQIENVATDTFAENVTTATVQTVREKIQVVTETSAADSAVVNDAPIITKLMPADSIKSTDQRDSVGAIVKSKAANKKTKKIEWGIGLTAGVSNISHGFSGVLSAVPAYDATVYASNLSSTPAPISSGSNNFSTPSRVQPGFAYGANIFISKPLAKKLQLRAGIGYSYFSSRIDVGEKIDSNKALVQYNVRTSSAGASSVTNSYTNRFHFIHLPVTLEQQIGRAGHFSVNGGLAFSWLAGSNALLYDKQKMIYYRDNSQVNKMQVGILAGFSYRVFSKSFLMETGPQVNYGLSNVFAKELYGNRHLFFAGIHTSIFFPKKK